MLQGRSAAVESLKCSMWTFPLPGSLHHHDYCCNCYHHHYLRNNHHFHHYPCDGHHHHASSKVSPQLPVSWGSSTGGIESAQTQLLGLRKANPLSAGSQIGTLSTQLVGLRNPRKRRSGGTMCSAQYWASRTRCISGGTLCSARVRSKSTILGIWNQVF